MPLALRSLCQGANSRNDSIRSTHRISTVSGTGNPFKIKSYGEVQYQLIVDFRPGLRANLQLVHIRATWVWGEAFPSSPSAHRGYLSSEPSAWVADIGGIKGGSSCTGELAVG